MAGTTTTDLNGLFKQVYAQRIEELIPMESVLTRSIKFDKRDQLGLQYNQPVVVRSEQGFTYSRPNNGAFNLQIPTTMIVQNAVLDGYQIMIQCGLAYEAVFRSEGNAAAFQSAVGLVMNEAMESFSRRVEIGLIYGQSATGLGQTNTATGVNATTTTLSFTAGQFAAGLWTTMEGAALDVYNSAGTALNTIGPVTVASVDLVGKTITVTAAAADITAINAASAVLNGFVRFYAGGSNGLDEQVGLDKIAVNTGVLFGINATTYNLWRANTYAVGGALTFQKIQDAIAIATARGLSEDVQLFVPPRVWQSLSTEQVAFRQLDSSYSRKVNENGFESLCFYSQNGKIEVIAHKYLKEGEAYAFPTKYATRVGASDISFNIPGTNNGEVFIQNPTTAGFQFRMYSNQNLLIERPATLIKFTGIVTP